MFGCNFKKCGSWNMCTCIIACMAHPCMYIDSSMHLKELTFIEFFAGQGNTWRHMRATSQPACGVDINYMRCPEQNPMDILSDAGLAYLP